MLLSHFPNNQGLSLDPVKKKVYDTLISAGEIIEALGLAGNNATEYYKKLNASQLNIISMAEAIANSLGR